VRDDVAQVGDQPGVAHADLGEVGPVDALEEPFPAAQQDRCKIANRAPRRPSSGAATMAGELKFGNDMKSMDPLLPTRATVCMSPITP
jgi:hypothetical protein